MFDLLYLPLFSFLNRTSKLYNEYKYNFTFNKPLFNFDALNAIMKVIVAYKALKINVV